MKYHVWSGFGTMAIVAMLLSAGNSLAFAADATTESGLAAKKEMVRKQQEQRITPAKRKAAAQALKEERLKIHRARQAAQRLDNK